MEANGAMQDLPQRKPGFLAQPDFSAYGREMNGQAERLGVFGGTFNPVHHGHLIAARYAAETLKLDRVLLVPNARSPLRREEVLVPAKLRLAMVDRAVRDEPGLEACDLEVRRKGVSYLVDTLEALRRAFPDAGLCFLMGADSLDTFDRWVRVEDIVRLAEVRVMPRPGADPRPALGALFKRAPGLAGGVRLVPEGPRIDISATEVRERVASGRSIRYLVPEGVEALIRGEGLYRGKGRVRARSGA